jgi:hypothetical protein
VWAGTPVYILQETRDGAWAKVQTPDCHGWIPSQALARVGPAFLAAWRQAVAQRGLTAVVATGVPVTDRHGVVRFQTYVGAAFPSGADEGGRSGILIPGRDPGTGMAMAETGFLPPGAGAGQPWACTPRHMAQLWKTLLGRPYGWGNLGFDNDCSGELKAFFTPFGLWLPRHSSEQIRSGWSTDLSGLDLAARIQQVRALGHPGLSLLWLEGHIMLYLGPLDYRTADGRAAKGFMTYQNLWGLRPTTGPAYRKIVGGSVLFPVLDRYPEAPELDSLANKRRLVLAHLDGP